MQKPRTELNRTLVCEESILLTSARTINQSSGPSLTLWMRILVQNRKAVVTVARKIRTTEAIMTPIPLEVGCITGIGRGSFVFRILLSPE
jgi:hypothetical protein